MKNFKLFTLFLLFLLSFSTFATNSCLVKPAKIQTVCDLTKYAKTRVNSAGYNYFQGYIVGYANKLNAIYQIQTTYCSYSYDEGTLVAAIRAALIANQASCANESLKEYLDDIIVKNSLPVCY